MSVFHGLSAGNVGHGPLLDTVVVVVGAVVVVVLGAVVVVVGWTVVVVGGAVVVVVLGGLGGFTGFALLVATRRVLVAVLVVVGWQDTPNSTIASTKTPSRRMSLNRHPCRRA